MNAALYDSLLELLVRRLHNQLAGAQLVDWAVDAVQQVVETDALVLLAGLSRDCALSEAVPLLDRGIAELGLTVPDPEGLRRAYVGAVSRAILAEEVPIPVALEHLHRWVVTPLNHPADLAPWCFLWEGSPSRELRVSRCRPGGGGSSEACVLVGFHFDSLSREAVKRS